MGVSPVSTIRSQDEKAVAGRAARLFPAATGASYQFLQLGLDLLALAGAWYATLELRLRLNPLMKLELTRTQAIQIAPPLWIILATWLIVVLRMTPYRRSIRESVIGSIWQALESALIMSSIAILVTFVWQGLGASLSRSFVLLLAPVSAIFLILARVLEGWFVTLFADRLNKPTRMAVVGSHEEALVFIEKIRRSSARSIDLAGIILPAREAEDGWADRKLVLGDSGSLAAVINRECLDRIVVLNGAMLELEAAECQTVAKRMGVIVSHALPTELTSDIRVEFCHRFGLPLIEARPIAFTRSQEIVKRICDVVISLGVLTLLSPLLFCIALGVKVTSEGPILYRSRRVGKGGRYFTFLKFRSMFVTQQSRTQVHALNEKSGHLFKMKNDPRVTPLGRILRRFSLDELPQLINVVRGDMSILGPRPLPAEDLDPDGQSSRFSVWAEQRSRVLPGITGLWQVRGRSDLTFEEMMELDIAYIRNWSLLLDLRILLATPVAVFSGRGAY